MSLWDGVPRDAQQGVDGARDETGRALVRTAAGGLPRGPAVDGRECGRGVQVVGQGLPHLLDQGVGTEPVGPGDGCTHPW